MIHMNTLKIGTRGSKLAIAQAESVKIQLLSFFPDISIEIIPIKSRGDIILDVALSKIGDKGLFTKEIENELLAGNIDLAVHSMKDMPTKLPEGLKIAAATKRLDPRDLFIPNNNISFSDLSGKSSVATGSLRRRAQLSALYPGIKIPEIRGNIISRLEKLRSNPDLDGIILARAGFERLNISDVKTEVIPDDKMIPAVGQASLAIEIRDNDTDVEHFTEKLNHDKTEKEIICEREFLASLEGGCQVPIGGYAFINNQAITIKGFASSIDGMTRFDDSVTMPEHEFRKAGRMLADKLLEKGAGGVLDEIYRNIGEDSNGPC